jgi:hypothetical protein
MPNNPDISRIASVPKRLMPARSALVPGGGVPASEALNNWMPAELVEGALCMVLDQASLYRFDKHSTTAPSGVNVIATMAGTGVPGRWKKLATGSQDKSYIALNYSGNSASPATVNTWTPFLNPNLILEHGSLSFDGAHSVVASKAMTVQIDWYISWTNSTGSPLWDGGILLNGTTTPVTGSICSDYSNDDQLPNESVMSACLITTLNDADAIALMVRFMSGVSISGLGAHESILVVTEL